MSQENRNIQSLIFKQLPLQIIQQEILMHIQTSRRNTCYVFNIN